MEEFIATKENIEKLTDKQCQYGVTFWTEMIGESYTFFKADNQFRRLLNKPKLKYFGGREHKDESLNFNSFKEMKQFIKDNVRRTW